MAEPATATDSADSRDAPNALDPAFAPIRELGLERYIAELEHYGYTVIPPERVAPPEFVARVRDAVLRVAHERTGVEHALDRPGDVGRYKTYPTQSDRYLLYYMLFEDEVFEEWLENPVLAAVIDYMMRGQAHLSSLLSFVKWRDENASPGDPATFLHSDATGGSPEGVLPATHSLVCNAALCLTDYTREDGCIAMVPGSHRLGRGPEPGEGADRAVPVEGPAGSLVAWLGNTWHGAFPKLTDGLRLNLTSYHCHPALKTQERYGSAVPPEMLARRSARFRRLMGVDDPMGWKEHGPDGELFIKLAARQTLADEERLRANARR
ncbi:MAG: phytanoyl-CoA dioxygenase family protein [Gammaproteobacteria bacterium]|nr:phytanoyl-CoA dioxygenase family protein [Gammaproteobacteria bacterium]